jgi:hypothetical protein
MNELSGFAITQKWPPRHPDRIQLYSLPTPNALERSAPREPSASQAPHERVAQLLELLDMQQNTAGGE